MKYSFIKKMNFISLDFLQINYNMKFTINNTKINCLTDLLKLLIKDESILKYKNEFDQDLYLLASKIGNIDIMEYLEEYHNWDIYVKDFLNYDAYLFACKYGQLEIMKYLEKKHKWDVYVKNVHENDAYLIASSNFHLHIMKYLDKEHNWNRKVRNIFDYDAYDYGNDEIREYLEKK